MGFINILDPVFSPLLALHPALGIFSIALIITFLVTIVYKYTTDQSKMKQLKSEMKEYQDKIRDFSKKNQPQKAMELQGKAMQKNLEYMKHSFKATLWTMLPVLIIFLWMSQNMAYHPISSGQEFTVTAYFREGHAPNATLTAIPDLTFISENLQPIAYNESQKGNVAVWLLKAPSVGEYKLEINYNSEKYDHTVLISDGKKYSTPEKIVPNSKLSKIVVGNDKVYPFTIFGLRFTWFWAYLLMSVILSILIRKILQVH